MQVLYQICFVCLTDSDKNNMNIVIDKETEEEIFIHVKYALPELIILNQEKPVYICSSCQTTLHAFSMFKKKCLDNYKRLNDYIKIMQESKDTPGPSNSESQFTFINCVPLVKLEPEVQLTIEENEDALLSWEQQHDEESKAEDIVNVKEDSADHHLYQQLVKIESVSDDEQDGGSSIALDKDKANFNSDTNSQELQCSMCNEVFSDKSTLDKHLTSHINNMTGLECSICKKKFSKKRYFSLHMKFHFGIKDFKCTICNKMFTQACSLKMHMKLHEGVRDYVCTICSKEFTRSHHLKIHMKMHEGIQDYECSVCKKKFTHSCNLKTHMKIHDAVKVCECSFDK